MKCLVIGGTGFLGRHLVAELLNAGHHVTVMHRRDRHGLGRRVKNLKVNRNDTKAVKAALSGAGFELVFDNAYDFEKGTTAAHVEATARAAAGDALHRYVFISSVAAYGAGLNHQEGNGLAPDDHPDVYVRNKAMSERTLFRLHQRIGLPAVTIRPPYIYGKGNPYYREAFFWDRLRAKRSVVLPGDGRRLMQFAYVHDIVWAMLRATEVDAAAGHAFNICNPRPISQIDAVKAYADAAGKKLELVRIPRDYILKHGGHPMGPNLYFGQYFDLPPITMVTPKAQRVLKFKATPFDEGLKETYKWYGRNGGFPEPDFTFEDQLIGRARQDAVVKS